MILFRDEHDRNIKKTINGAQAMKQDLSGIQTKMLELLVGNEFV